MCAQENVKAANIQIKELDSFSTAYSGTLVSDAIAVKELHGKLQKARDDGRLQESIKHGMKIVLDQRGADVEGFYNTCGRTRTRSGLRP